MMAAPVRVDPVKVIFAISGWRDKRIAGRAAVALHDVEEAGRHTCLDRELGQAQHRVRRQLRGLQHDGVACRKRCADFHEVITSGKFHA
jgi:hypothetical protein